MTVSCPSLSRELLESELFGHIKGSFTGAIATTWGKVAAADRGTLFLDEIGELPLEMQPKLLRLLQERTYERVGESKIHMADVRVIAATNRDLKQAVAAGAFREDLLYRLDVISLRMPALRERPNDILAIAESQLRQLARQAGKNVTGFSKRREHAVAALFVAGKYPGAAQRGGAGAHSLRGRGARHSRFSRGDHGAGQRSALILAENIRRRKSRRSTSGRCWRARRASRKRRMS